MKPDPLPRPPVVRGRHPFVVERCRGKRVLHLGCVDSGLLAERLASAELLHVKLSEVAANLVGVDLDAEGLEQLEALGYRQLVHADLCSDAWPALVPGPFDVVVASEVLEHLPDPASFLRGLSHVGQRDRADVILTVPNAYGVKNVLWMLRGRELVHPDHCYWFSYRTLTRLLRFADLDVTETYVYSFEETKLRVGGRRTPRTLVRRLVAALLLRRSPFWGDGIIVVLRAR